MGSAGDVAARSQGSATSRVTQAQSQLLGWHRRSSESAPSYKRQTCASELMFLSPKSHSVVTPHVKSHLFQMPPYPTVRFSSLELITEHTGSCDAELPVMLGDLVVSPKHFPHGPREQLEEIHPQAWKGFARTQRPVSQCL